MHTNNTSCKIYVVTAQQDYWHVFAYVPSRHATDYRDITVSRNHMYVMYL